MNNWVSDCIDDVQDRLGKPAGLDEPKVLRAMQRCYEDLNRVYRLVEKSLVIAAGDLSDSVNYVALPAGWICPYRVEDSTGSPEDFDYVAVQAFDAAWGSLTISEFDGRLYFSGVSDSTALTIYYYSLGSTLAAKEDADLAAGEVNALEWNRGDKSLLLYRTCLELDTEYPLAALDLVKVQRMEGEINRTQANRQRVKPPIVGGTDEVYVPYKEYFYG